MKNIILVIKAERWTNFECNNWLDEEHENACAFQTIAEAEEYIKGYISDQHPYCEEGEKWETDNRTYLISGTERFYFKIFNLAQTEDWNLVQA